MSESIVVLLVDGEVDDPTAVPDRLRRADERLAVTVVNGAEEAAETLERSPVDCVVSGYHLPDGTGLDLLETVRESDGRLPVVLFTDEGSAEIARRAVAADVSDYVPRSGDAGGCSALAASVASVVEGAVERERATGELGRYETLLELMPDTVVVTDTDGTHREIHGAEGWSGYSREELIGEPIAKTMTDDSLQRAEEIVADLIRNDDREKATFEQEVVTKDGDPIPFENHVTLLPPDEDGMVPGTMSVLRDITERKERERSLRRQNARLDRFASVVSHDIRNPLNVAAGRIELERDRRDSEHLAKAQAALRRLDDIVEDVLTLARRGDRVVDPDQVDLRVAVDAAWTSVATGSVRLEAAEDLGTVRADESRLRQLLENLFRNAVDHVEGSVTVRVGRLPGAREDRAGFYVEDDGPGIPEGDRESIFESGYTTSTDGTGFGLSIVKEIVEAHGWAVRATESEEGGARFEIQTA